MKWRNGHWEEVEEGEDAIFETDSWSRQVTVARKLIRTTVRPSHTHHHYVRTPRCLQLLLTSLPRRARAAGLQLRLPASQPEQAAARSAAAGHVGGEEAACRGRP